jgi:hypothetical protein
VIGDDLAAPPPGGEGLATALAAELRAHFALPNVRVDDRSAPGLTAALASVMPVPADTSPDLVVIFLGVADALRFDAADFRAAVARLYAQLLEGTHALVVVVLPPRIPHSAQLDRAAECAGADTSQAAWQLATLASDIALVDAEAAIKKSGVPVTAAFADNLSLSDAGRKLIVQAVLALFP